MDDETPGVNPNYGGDEEVTAHDDPEANPNYGGERANEVEDIDHVVDPEANPNYGGEERPRPSRERH